VLLESSKGCRVVEAVVRRGRKAGDFVDSNPLDGEVVP